MKTKYWIGLLLVSFVLVSCTMPDLSTQPVPQETAAESSTDLPPAAETETPAGDVLEPTLQLDKTEYTPGEEMHIRFSAPAGLAANAWVGIVPAETPHGSEADNDAADVAFEYIDGRTQGVVVLPAPEQPGSYDIRMFDSDGDGQELFSVNITVTGSLATANQITCQAVTLNLPDDLAAGIACETVPATVGATDLPPWDIHPEYTALKLDGYTVADSFHTPKIYVFPVEGYEAASEQAALIIDDLRALLDEQPANPEAIPVLPAFNAAQMLRTQVEYLRFQNGSGVRFLTMYAQAAYPVNNQGLIYVYQGLTDDGKYYVSAILPVTHPDLQPTGANAPNGDWPAFNENFENYLAEITLQINQYEAGSFSPTLTVLDGMMESITVE